MAFEINKAKYAINLICRFINTVLSIVIALEVIILFLCWYYRILGLEELIKKVSMVFITDIFVVLSMIRLSYYKPNQKQIEMISNQLLYHYTNEKSLKRINLNNGKVYLKRTQGFKNNIYNFFRPAVYFFIGEPSKLNLICNTVDKQDVGYRIRINIKNLDNEKIRIRKFDSVIMYLGDYIGNAEIEKI